MPAPDGVRNNRWNQAVRQIGRDRGWSDAEADAWLRQVWESMLNDDEVVGDDVAHDRLRKWLEAQAVGASTLPMAFQRWAVVQP